MKTVFEFVDYKAYLRAKVGERKQRRGTKSAMAQALRCQPTYVSQILYGSANLSLEQAEVLNGFFGHSKEESDFFFLLIQLDRAGTPALRAYFKEKVDESLKRRLVLTERLGSRNSLSQEDQSRYYSSWKYAAIHIAVTIPALQTREALSDFFRLPATVVAEALEFLISCGLVREEQGRYQTGTAMIRLGNQSHNILKHHTNWRNQAIESLDREQLSELHYSGVLSISKEDALRIKDALLESIRRNAEIIRSSKEEELYVYCVDFFSLRRS